eukprot:9491867-Pyramimonas_sp.AAC.1
MSAALARTLLSDAAQIGPGRPGCGLRQPSARSACAGGAAARPPGCTRRARGAATGRTQATASPFRTRT